MSLTKLVDGERVSIEPAEEAQLQAEWGAWVPPTLEDTFRESLDGDPRWGALIRMLATELGKTEAAVKAALIASRAP